MRKIWNIPLLLVALLLALFIPDRGYAQIVQGGITTPTTAGCAATTAIGSGLNAYQAENVYKNPCVVATATALTSGLTIVDTVTTTSVAGTPVAISATTGQIYGLVVSVGANTTRTFANFYNRTPANVTVGTTTQIFTVEFPPNSNGGGSTVIIPWGTPIGIPFTTALSVNCTTTRGGATVAGSACGVTALIK